MKVTGGRDLLGPAPKRPRARRAGPEDHTVVRQAGSKAPLSKEVGIEEAGIVDRVGSCSPGSRWPTPPS